MIVLSKQGELYCNSLFTVLVFLYCMTESLYSDQEMSSTAMYVDAVI